MRLPRLRFTVRRLMFAVAIEEAPANFNVLIDNVAARPMRIANNRPRGIILQIEAAARGASDRGIAIDVKTAYQRGAINDQLD